MILAIFFPFQDGSNLYLSLISICLYLNVSNLYIYLYLPNIYNICIYIPTLNLTYIYVLWVGLHYGFDVKELNLNYHTREIE